VPPEQPAPADQRPGVEPIVLVEDVARTFGDRTVVEGISFAVEPGTIVGVIGPSAAGKTTTIRMLTGSLRPSRGTVRVLGRDPAKFRRRDRERIGYMPQQFTLYRDLTASENVDFVASLFGMLWPRRRSRVKQVLKVVELWDARGRRAGRLSGGQQRRLELACALVHQPDLIILDEPTAGLDPILRETIWAELHRLRDEGRTLLITTQYVGEAEECDVVALIAEGRLIALAPPAELRRKATKGDIIEVETVAVFDGASLSGVAGVHRVDQDGPRHLRVVVDDAGTALPDVVEAIQQTGVEVVSAREYRPSFDEVFAALVTDNATNGAATHGGDAEERGRRNGVAA
jgi:ABC-2 type transport system ATP-binding protein